MPAKMMMAVKKHDIATSQSTEEDQLMQTTDVDWNTLPTEILLEILVETCVVNVKDHGADHNKVLSTLSKVCQRWRQIIQRSRPNFINRVLEADPTYDYGPETRVKEIDFIGRRYPTVMAADGDRFYVLSYESIGPNWFNRRYGIQVCETTGWDSISKHGTQHQQQQQQQQGLANIRFIPNQRLILDNLSMESSIKCMQVLNDLQSIYLVQTVAVDDVDSDRSSDDDTGEIGVNIENAVGDDVVAGSDGQVDNDGLGFGDDGVAGSDGQVDNDGLGFGDDGVAGSDGQVDNDGLGFGDGGVAVDVHYDSDTSDSSDESRVEDAPTTGVAIDAVRPEGESSVDESEQSSNYEFESQAQVAVLPPGQARLPLFILPVAPAPVSFVCRVHSITGLLISRWRIDTSVVFPPDWQHAFITVEPRTGNVIIPDASGRRLLEYSPDGVLLHVINVGGNVPVIKAFRILAPAVHGRRTGDDVTRERLNYIVTLRSDSAESIVKYNLIRVSCVALADTATTPVQMMASYSSATSLFDVIDVIHERVLLAEWCRSSHCHCCVQHCRLRLHRVADLEPSRQDDVHEPTFYRCEDSKWLCFDRKTRMLFIAGYGINMHCVNLWRDIE